MCLSPEIKINSRRAAFLAPELESPPRNGMAVKCAAVLDAIRSDWRCHVITSKGGPFHSGATEAAEVFGHWYPKVDELTILDLPVKSAPWRLWAVFKAALRLESPGATRYLDGHNRRILGDLLRDGSYAIVYCDLYFYLGCIPKRLFAKTLLSINDAHGLAFDLSAKAAPGLFGKAVFTLRSWYYDRFEEATLRNVKAVHVVTQKDKDYLVERHHLDNIHVIPLAIGTAYFEAVLPDYRLRRVLMHGNFDADERRTFGIEFVKRAVVSGEFIDVEWVLLGRGSESLARKFPRTYHVEALECVDDHASLLASCPYGVYPERGGSGTKNRIVQHMAVGACVISTPEMLLGIPGAKSGQHLLVASSADGLVDHLAGALRHPGNSSQIAVAGRALCMEEFSSSVIYRQWRDLFALVGGEDQGHPESLRCRAALRVA